MARGEGGGGRHRPGRRGSRCCCGTSAARNGGYRPKASTQCGVSNRTRAACETVTFDPTRPPPPTPASASQEAPLRLPACVGTVSVLCHTPRGDKSHCQQQTGPPRDLSSPDREASSEGRLFPASSDQRLRLQNTSAAAVPGIIWSEVNTASGKPPVIVLRMVSLPLPDFYSALTRRCFLPTIQETSQSDDAVL